MGIMYKLMKHKKFNLDLRKPQNNTNTRNDRNRLITMEGNIIEAPMAPSQHTAVDESGQSMDSSTDKQFTAEHIIQLCKFLAEKSRKNKSLHRQSQSPKKSIKFKQSEFTFQPPEDHDNYNEINLVQNEALPLLSKQRLEPSHQARTDNENCEGDEFESQTNASVLSARLSPAINSLNISLNTITASSCNLHRNQQQQPHNINNQPLQHQQQHQPHQPQTQGKRDILLKIRRQIIERKRLRENGAFEPQALNNSQVWRPW